MVTLMLNMNKPVSGSRNYGKDAQTDNNENYIRLTCDSGVHLVEIQNIYQRQYYELCNKKSITPEEKLFRSIGLNCFVTHVDYLSPDELTASFDFLQRYSGVIRISVALNKTIMRRKHRNKLQYLGLDKPFAQSAKGSSKIIKSIAISLAKSANIERIDILNIPVPLASSKLLYRALRQTKSMIRSLDLSGSGLGDSGLKVLCNGLCQAPALSNLNLSKCMLTDDSQTLICQILRAHAIRRDEKYWSLSLRGRAPRFCSDGGLLFLDLSHNSFGDTTMKNLCELLVHDKWLFGINMSNNQLSPRGIVAVTELLQNNKTLLAFPVHHNENSDENLTQFIENILKKRYHLISENLSRASSVLQSSSDNNLYYRILQKWNIPKEYLYFFNNKTDDAIPEIIKQESLNHDNGLITDILCLSSEEDETDNQISHDKKINIPLKHKLSKTLNERRTPIKNIDNNKQVKKSNLGIDKKPLNVYKRKEAFSHRLNKNSDLKDNKCLKNVYAKNAKFLKNYENSTKKYNNRITPSQKKLTKVSTNTSTIETVLSRINGLEISQEDSIIEMEKLKKENEKLRNELNGNNNDVLVSSSQMIEPNDSVLNMKRVERMKRKRERLERIERTESLLKDLEKSITYLTNQVQELEINNGIEINKMDDIRMANETEIIDKKVTDNSFIDEISKHIHVAFNLET